EVVSDSDPTDPTIADVDPDLITAFKIVAAERVHQLGADPASFSLISKAKGEQGGKVFNKVDISKLTGDMAFDRHNTTVVAVNFDGVFTVLAEGEAELGVELFNAAGLQQTVALKVVPAIEQVEKTLLATGTDNSFLWHNKTLWVWGD